MEMNLPRENRPKSSEIRSRRTFLKGSASAAALLGVPGSILAQDTPKADPPKPDVPQSATPQPAPTPKPPATEPVRLRIALVGCGGQGRHDLKNLLGLKERIVALCDVDERQIDGARKDGGDATAKAKAYTDYRNLLADAKEYDAVLIAPRAHWHAPLA